MLIDQIHPTETQITQLKTYPKNTSIVMLNILKNNKLATTNETGQEAYTRYLKNAAPFVAKADAKFVWKGYVHSTLIGNSNNQPQVVFLVEYPSVEHFFNMVANHEYQKIAIDRSIALEYGGLIACKTVQ